MLMVVGTTLSSASNRHSPEALTQRQETSLVEYTISSKMIFRGTGKNDNSNDKGEFR